MTQRHATSVRFTPEQAGWLRKRAFDLNIPQQLIIEDALAAQGMPRGGDARPGDRLASGEVPGNVKDVTDALGQLWIRSQRGGWQRADLQAICSDSITLIREHGPLTVGKLRGQ